MGLSPDPPYFSPSKCHLGPPRLLTKAGSYGPLRLYICCQIYKRKAQQFLRSSLMTCLGPIAPFSGRLWFVFETPLTANANGHHPSRILATLRPYQLSNGSSLTTYSGLSLFSFLCSIELNFTLYDSRNLYFDFDTFEIGRASCRERV